MINYKKLENEYDFHNMKYKTRCFRVRGDDEQVQAYIIRKPKNVFLKNSKGFYMDSDIWALVTSFWNCKVLGIKGE